MHKATAHPNTRIAPAPQPAADAPLTCASRRNVLATLAGGVALTTLNVATLPAGATESADAELLAVLAEFEALEGAIYPPRDPTRPPTIEDEAAWDDAVQPLHARQRALLDRICELPTHSLEGFRARAHALVMWTECLIADMQKGADEGYWPEKMQIALFRDLLGEG